MKHMRRLICMALMIATVLSLSVSAFAAEYTFESTSDSEYYPSTSYGSMDTMPEIIGLMLWKEGHVGVYIGGGYVIEAMGTKKGVVKTELEGRGWQGWCKLPYIDYLEVE